MRDSGLGQSLLPLEPHYVERVWGGQRLKAATPPIGEAWIAFEQSIIRSGTHRGRSVRELVETWGHEILGDAVQRRYGARFPLLVKLLDCADWLSVQVHPNDEQAERLVGSGAFGKTEAWHVLDATPGARVLAGVRPGTSRDELARAISRGSVLDYARQIEVRAGDSLLVPAGTLHALGPGLLLYEVQQASDTTYRVYDWDRPASAGRALHLDQSIAVVDPTAAPVVRPSASDLIATAVACPYFHLEVLSLNESKNNSALFADTLGQSFHLVTVAEGSVEARRGDEVLRLDQHDTVLAAGGAGAYDLRVISASAKVLRARVPGE